MSAKACSRATIWVFNLSEVAVERGLIAGTIFEILIVGRLACGEGATKVVVMESMAEAVVLETVGLECVVEVRAVQRIEGWVVEEQLWWEGLRSRD